MARVDIVIPSYGRLPLLREAVDSVVRQSIGDWQLWIVDDASHPPLLRSDFADPRMHLLRLDVNAGPAFARNIGAAQGSAAYLAFLDSDDLWHPRKLERQVEILERDRTCEWVHTHEAWYRNGTPVRQRARHRKQAGVFYDRAVERCLISPSAVMLRRKFFERSGGFAPAFRLCEDFELWLRLLLKAPIAYLDEPLTIKRAGDWPQLSNTREIDRYRVLALHRVLRTQSAHLQEAHYQLLVQSAMTKCEWLISGAERHRNAQRLRRYQAWLSLFSTLRTRPMR